MGAMVIQDDFAEEATAKQREEGQQMAPALHLVHVWHSELWMIAVVLSCGVEPDDDRF